MRIPATTRGYARLATWAEAFGTVDKVGMEGAGSSGAGLLRFLADYGLTVIEVDRSDRYRLHRSGDRAVQSGRASGTPKSRDAQVEMIRVLRVARSLPARRPQRQDRRASTAKELTDARRRCSTLVELDEAFADGEQGRLSA